MHQATSIPNLKYLFDRRTDLVPLLRQIPACAGDASFWVEDEGCSLLFGQSYPAPAHRHPVLVEGRPIGWVSGGATTAFVAAMLTAFAIQESEKKKLRAEVRHLYRAIRQNTAPAPEPEDAFIQKLKDILDKNLPDEAFALPELCRALGMSRSRLFRKMKALINTAPSHFIRAYRLHRAKELLECTGLKVAEVAYTVGYKDPAYFSHSFQEVFGVRPSAVHQS